MPPPSPTASRFVDLFSYTLRGVRDAFVVAKEPFASIGGQRQEPNEELDPTHPFISALRLANGNIVVNDLTQLKFFRSDGSLVRAVGRQGRGPKEFTQTREMCRLRGDSILVFNYAGQASLWDSAGGFVRAFSKPPGRRVPGSCDECGNFIMQQALPRSGAADADGGDVMYSTRIVRPNGSVLRELGALPGPDSRALVSRVPSVIPIGESLLVCNARSYELQWKTMTGETSRIVRLRRRPLAITEAESRARIARSVPRNIPGSDADALVRNLTAKGLPKRWPAYSAVRIDVAGRVWVSDYESEAAWTVFDSSGALLGRVDLGKGRPLQRVRLVDIGRDYIAIASPDADGPVQIRYHRIAAAGGWPSR